MNKRASFVMLLSSLSLLAASACAVQTAGDFSTPAPAPSAVAGWDDSAAVPSETPVADLPPLPAADFVALMEDMQKAIDTYWVAGQYAVAVTDLQTGETVSVNGDMARLSGCVMNLFVIFQVARDLEEGRYDVGRAEALVAATTWSSNAATARDLYELAGDGDATRGVERVDQLIRDVLKLDQVLIDHPPLYHNHSLGRDYNNWVTAEDVNKAMLVFWRGEIVGPEWQAWVLDHLASVKPGLNYLTAAVPEGVVSHKNGFLQADTGYVDNDTGIIRLQRGGAEIAYAVTFLSEQVPSKYGDVALGQQLSKLAYTTMAARYP